MNRCKVWATAPTDDAGWFAVGYDAKDQPMLYIGPFTSINDAISNSAQITKILFSYGVANYEFQQVTSEVMQE